VDDANLAQCAAYYLAMPKRCRRKWLRSLSRADRRAIFDRAQQPIDFGTDGEWLRAHYDAIETQKLRAFERELLNKEALGLIVLIHEFKSQRPRRIA